MGLKSDLRENPAILERLTSKKQSPITREQGEAMMAAVDCQAYFECSALTQEGLNEIFARVCHETRLKKPEETSNYGGYHSSSCSDSEDAYWNKYQKNNNSDR